MLEYEDENANSPGRFKKRRRPMSAASRIAAATLAQFQDAASSTSSSSSSDADPSNETSKRRQHDGASAVPRNERLSRKEGVDLHRNDAEDEDAMAEDRVFLRELALEGRAERSGGDVEFCDADHGSTAGASRRRPGDPFLDAEDVDPAEDMDPDDLGAPLADFSAAGVAALLGFTPSAAVAAGTVTARQLDSAGDAVPDSGERPTTARRTAAAAAAADAERAAFLWGITKVELVIDSRLQSLRALGDLVPNVHELRFRHSARSHLSSFRDFGTTAFRSLRVLWVCNCALSSLSGVQHLHQLTELYASFNAITSLDPCADLLNLEVLDVEANLIALPPPVTWSDLIPDANEIDTPAVMRARVRDALYGVANLSELRTLTLSGNPLAFDVLRWEQAAIEANEAHGRGRLGGAATAVGVEDPPTLRQMVFAAVPSLEILDDAEADEHDRLDQQHQSAGGLNHSTSGGTHAPRGPRALLAAAGATASGSNPPTPPPPSGPTTPTPNSGGPADGPDALALSPNRRSTAPGGGAGSPSLRPPTAASRVADAQARLAALEEEFLVLRASVAKRPQDFNDAAAAASGATFFGATEALPPRPLSAMAAPTSARVTGAAPASGRVGTAVNSEPTNSALWAFRPTTASSFLFDAAASRTFAKYATSTAASLGAPDGRIGARVGGFDVLERARAENAKSLRGGPTTSATDDSSGGAVRQRPSTARVGRSVEFSLPGAGTTAGAPPARVPNTARDVDSSNLGRNSAADASPSPSAAGSSAPIHSRGGPPAVAAASIATTKAHTTASPLPPKPVATAASLAAAVAGPPPPPVASAAAAKPRLRAPLAVGAPSPVTSAGPTPTALSGVGGGVIRRPQAALRPLVTPAAAATAGSPSASAGISAPVTALPYGRPSSGGGLGAAGLGLRPPSSGLRQVLPTRAAPSRPTTGSLVTLDAGASQSPQRRVGGGGASHSRSSSGESIESSESSRRSSPRVVAAAPVAPNEVTTRRQDSRRSGGSSRGTSSSSSSSSSSGSRSSSAASSSSSDASPLQARYAGGRSDISGAAALPAATAIADALNPVDVRPASAISAAAAAAAVPSLVLQNAATEEGPTSRAATQPIPHAAAGDRGAARDLLASPVGESLFQHLRVDDDLLPGLPSNLLGGMNALSAEEDKADVLACGSATDDDGDGDHASAAAPAGESGSGSNWRERAERIQALLRAMPQVPAPMPRASAASSAAPAVVAAAGAADSSGADTPSPLTMTPVESSRGGIDLPA